jgi:hypothetical protein
MYLYKQGVHLMQRITIYAVLLFIAFTAAMGAMLVAAQGQADLYTRTVLIALGSAIFGSGLTVLLVRLLGTADVSKGL